ncbi:MAG: YggU family protein [Acidobacteria bacterium]|nr:YggU family protein [Acidobacteriota bacterium]
MIKLTVTAQTVTFAVRVQPRASRSEIAGELDGALKLRLAAPPVDGEANEELIRLLSKLFRLPRASVELLSGATNKNKVVRLHGVSQAEVEQTLQNELRDK